MKAMSLIRLLARLTLIPNKANSGCLIGIEEKGGDARMGELVWIIEPEASVEERDENPEPECWWFWLCLLFL